MPSVAPVSCSTSIASAHDPFHSPARTRRSPSTMRRRTARISAKARSAVAARADAYRLEGGRWPTRTITYYNEVPAYDWSVDTAAYAWNTSGARVQFVKTSRANAKVLLGIRWYHAAGDAHIQKVGDMFMN